MPVNAEGLAARLNAKKNAGKLRKWEQLEWGILTKRRTEQNVKTGDEKSLQPRVLANKVAILGKKTVEVGAARMGAPHKKVGKRMCTED